MKDTYEKKGFKITSTCGNSLGGGLADYIGLLHPEVKTVTLDPALLPEGVVDGNLKYSNITNYFSRYDPLTLAERSGHLDGRIPGDHFIIYNGIPLFSDLASNHTGYVQGSLDAQFYMVGVKGQPGYGKIYIDADEHVVTSIFETQLKKYKNLINSTKSPIFITSLSFLFPVFLFFISNRMQIH